MYNRSQVQEGCDRAVCSAQAAEGASHGDGGGAARVPGRDRRRQAPPAVVAEAVVRAVLLPRHSALRRNLAGSMRVLDHVAISAAEEA